MKKFMKTVAAGLSALIGMSVLTATASADMDIDYLLDENNIVWEDKSGIRCYENGEMIDVSGRTYKLYIVPANNVTAEDLGVDFTKLVPWTDNDNLPANTTAVDAENSEELMALCDKAQTWYDNGLITYAYGFELINYACVWGMELQITLKEADKDYDPTEEYEWLEDAEFVHNDTYDVYTITAYNKIKDPEISEQINADERVDNCIVSIICCAVAHAAVEEVFSIEEVPVQIPDSEESAKAFYEEYGETAVNPDGESAVIVVRDDGITDKYGYVFSKDIVDGEDFGYTVTSSEKYGVYDVYEISFNEKRDYSIDMLFWDHEKEQQEVRGAALNLVYEYDEEEGMKLSETPSTNKQVEIFREKYGNSEVFGNKAVVIAEDVYVMEADSASDMPEATAEYQVCANVDTANMKAYGDDIIIPTGNPLINVYEFDLNENTEYSLQILSGHENNIWSVYNYSLGMSESGNAFASDTIQHKGDVDNNGTVGDLYDIIHISKYVMNMIDMTDIELLLADSNADGEVNLYDAIEMAKTLMS